MLLVRDKLVACPICFFQNFFLLQYSALHPLPPFRLPRMGWEASQHMIFSFPVLPAFGDMFPFTEKPESTPHSPAPAAVFLQELIPYTGTGHGHFFPIRYSFFSVSSLLLISSIPSRHSSFF